MPKKDRILTAVQRLDAAYALASATAYDDRALWGKLPSGTIKPVTLSAEQQAAMDFFTSYASSGNYED